MRPLEIATAVLAGLGALSLVVPNRQKLAMSILLLAALVLLIHLLWEGPRLQAVPIYISLAALFLLALLPFGGLRITATILAVTAAAFGLLLCYLYPVVAFPAPGGPLAIGTHVFYFADRSRTEEYSGPPGQPRRIAAQVWYPAANGSGVRATYRDAKALIWRSWHLRYVRTHAFVDAPFDQTAKNWPVVFFSPSSGGFRSQDTFLTENLVANGYIVVGFDHPDTSSRIAFPDGYLAHSLPDTWVNIESRAALARSTPKTTNILETNVRDMQYVYDAFERADPESELGRIAAHMDFSESAAVGHSFGGGAAAELCRIDSRFKTGVNMDGWMFGGVNQEGTRKPFLFLVEGMRLSPLEPGPFPDNEDGVGRMGDRDFLEAAEGSVKHWGGCVIRLLGANHASFSDMALYQRPLPWRQTDEPSPEMLHVVVRDVVRSFLDDQLKGGRSELAASISKYSRSLEVQCSMPHDSSKVPTNMKGL